MWDCPRCGEGHEDVLQTCWKCGGDPTSRKLDGFLKLLDEPSTLLSLQEYFDLIRGLPLPTVEQRRNFVDHVASAHSWYKHLPKYLPGKPFYFFIDRFAGCDCIARRDGSYGMEERKVKGFHYADLPTAEYRARFGFMSYSCAEGIAVLFPGQTMMPRDKVVAVSREDGTPCRLPDLILDAGRAMLTAIVHPRSPIFYFWHPRAPDVPTRPKTTSLKVHWPDESGGRAAYEKICERCAEMLARGHYEFAPPSDAFDRLKECRTEKEKREFIERAQADPILYNLMKPERARQKAEMLKAIDRVCRLVDAAGPSSG